MHPALEKLDAELNLNIDYKDREKDIDDFIKAGVMSTPSIVISYRDGASSGHAGFKTESELRQLFESAAEIDKE